VKSARQRRGGAAEQQAGADAGPPFSHPDSNPLNALQAGPVDFVGSFPDPRVELEPVLPEIAFIGRSNVGKSSLINALVGKQGLARVSGSPGKTTLLNFYQAPGFYLVDLPGYGFAKASHGARAGYRRLVNDYLRTRRTLAGVVWLLDIRHDPSKEDREMQELLATSERPVLPTFTKADKLTRSTLGPRTRALAQALGIETDQAQVTSSRSRSGIAELAASIVAAAREAT
jgi:GTP-binding protein